MYAFSFHVHKTTDTVELEKTLEWTLEPQVLRFLKLYTMSQRADENSRITFILNTLELSLTVHFPKLWLWFYPLASLHSDFKQQKKKGQEIQFLTFVINFGWGPSCRVWGLQRAPQPNRNSAQVLLTSLLILQLRLLIFNFHIKLSWWKRLLHGPTCHCLTVDLQWRSLKPKQMRTAYTGYSFCQKLIWTETPMNITSNTLLLCLDTSFCLHIYV